MDSWNSYVKLLAAETIQDAYRRYRECKSAIKIRKVRSYESLVKAMAATTIKRGIRSLLLGKKMMKLSTLSDDSGSIGCPTNAERLVPDTSKPEERQFLHPSSAPPFVFPIMHSRENGAIQAPTLLVERSKLSTQPTQNNRRNSHEKKSTNGYIGGDTTANYLPEKERVIDNLFSRAMRKVCAYIQIKQEEVAVILNAFGFSETAASNIPQKPPVPSPGKTNANLYPRERESLGIADMDRYSSGSDFALSLTSTASFASSISSSLRSLRTHYTDPSIGEAHLNQLSYLPEDAASAAVGKLRDLVSGPWFSHARAFILEVCAKSDFGAGRPSNWADSYVHQLITILKIPAMSFVSCSGLKFLSMNVDDLSVRYGVSASLLKSRLSVYQELLKLVEHAWQRGQYPGDAVKASKAESLSTSASQNKLKQTVALTGDSSGLFPAIRSSLSPANSTTRISSRNCAASSSSSSSGRVCVEIFSHEELLPVWLGLNRAYAWSIPVEVLAALSVDIGQQFGYILSSAELESISDSSIYAGRRGRESRKEERLAPEVCASGCKWVAFYETSVRRTTDGAPLGGLDIYDKVLERSALDPSLHDISRQFSFGVSKGIALMVPASCIRIVKNTGSSRSKPSLADVPLEDIKVGSKVTVGSYLRLHRVLASQDWWDRPPDDLLLQIAGKTAEIVSTRDLQAKGRLGLRFNLDDAEVIDALPISVLFLFVSVTSSVSQNTQRLLLRDRSLSSSTLPTAQPSDATSAVGVAASSVGGTSTDTTNQHSLSSSTILTVQSSDATSAVGMIDAFRSKKTIKKKQSKKGGMKRTKGIKGNKLSGRRSNDDKDIGCIAVSGPIDALDLELSCSDSDGGSVSDDGNAVIDITLPHKPRVEVVSMNTTKRDAAKSSAEEMMPPMKLSNEIDIPLQPKPSEDSFDFQIDYSVANIEDRPASYCSWISGLRTSKNIKSPRAISPRSSVNLITSAAPARPVNSFLLHPGPAPLSTLKVTVHNPQLISDGTDKPIKFNWNRLELSPSKKKPKDIVGEVKERDADYWNDVDMFVAGASYDNRKCAGDGDGNAGLPTHQGVNGSIAATPVVIAERLPSERKNRAGGETSPRDGRRRLSAAVVASRRIDLTLPPGLLPPPESLAPAAIASRNKSNGKDNVTSGVRPFTAGSRNLYRPIIEPVDIEDVGTKAQALGKPTPPGSPRKSPRINFEPPPLEAPQIRPQRPKSAYAQGRGKGMAVKVGRREGDNGVEADGVRVMSGGEIGDKQQPFGIVFDLPAPPLPTVATTTHPSSSVKRPESARERGGKKWDKLPAGQTDSPFGLSFDPPAAAIEPAAARKEYPKSAIAAGAVKRKDSAKRLSDFLDKVEGREKPTSPINPSLKKLLKREGGYAEKELKNKEKMLEESLRELFSTVKKSEKMVIV